MFKKQIAVVLAAAFLSGAAFADSLAQTQGSVSPAKSTAPHWAYEGAEGPEHWGELDPKFSACAIGKNQSPVNLTNPTSAKLDPLRFEYKAQGYQVVNNGHTIQVDFAEGSSISVGGHQFGLKQFHVHSPSENQINGKSFPMEAHFVHADDKGNLAVVAVMFEEGKANAELGKAWQVMPKEAGGKVALVKNILASAIMPKDKSYYRFSGSLTTPPCTEGVIWLVLKYPVTVSKEQIEEFTHVMHHHNNRPVQPLNSRLILN